jgi:hypothetical protein
MTDSFALILFHVFHLIQHLSNILFYFMLLSDIIG